MKKIFIANWKMQLLPHESVVLAGEMIERLGTGVPDTEIVLAPTHDALALVAEKIAGTKLMLGAQDCFWEEKGAYTGEVSPRELNELGCKYVLVGHSERRQNLGETDEMVAKKLKAVLANGMTPVLCVGETLEERESGGTEEVLKRQVSSAISKVDFKKNELVVAYEPIWAIGTGRSASPTDVAAAHKFIKDMLPGNTRIIYGGSVNGKNMKDLLAVPDVSGALVGGASLSAKEFEEVVKA